MPFDSETKRTAVVVDVAGSDTRLPLAGPAIIFEVRFEVRAPADARDVVTAMSAPRCSSLLPGRLLS